MVAYSIICWSHITHCITKRGNICALFHTHHLKWYLWDPLHINYKNNFHFNFQFNRLNRSLWPIKLFTLQANTFSLAEIRQANRECIYLELKLLWEKTNVIVCVHLTLMWQKMMHSISCIIYFSMKIVKRCYEIRWVIHTDTNT